jgi:CelD/BcsL family acetyltransferase involved in cellulose biosynthesis
VTVVRDAAGLEEHLAAWEELAAAAAEPNIFYEPWMLLPALRAYGSGLDLRFVLVFGPPPSGRGSPLLCGLFPLERRRRYRGLPVSNLGLWKYVHCFLCTPLVRADCGRACLEAFFRWLAADPGSAPLMEFGHIGGEGEFHRLLVDQVNAGGRLTFVPESFTRGVLRRAKSAEDYLASTLSGQRRKKLRRARRLLEESAKVEQIALAPGDDVGVWVEDFLRLEQRGWKGREGTALACSRADREFFTAAATEAFRRGRLVLHGLRANGRPIALLCNFLAGRGAFAFKVAFDEAYADYSPGVLVELEDIRRFHDRGELDWLDSCSAGGGPALVDVLWRDRRVIQTVVVDTGRWPGGLVVSCLPLLRWLRRLFSRTPRPAPQENE